MLATVPKSRLGKIVKVVATYTLIRCFILLEVYVSIDQNLYYFHHQMLID